MQNRDISVNLEKIKEMTKDKGISLCRLEIEAGLTNGTVRKWYKQQPNIKTLFKVAEVLGVNIEDLTEIH